MGYATEFNWVLKLKPEQGLDEARLVEGKIYSFTKADLRVYPVNIPINLVNSGWEVIARVNVLEFTCKENNTSGKYKVLKIYDSIEKEVLTLNQRENVEIIKGKKIQDFSNVKVS